MQISLSLPSISYNNDHYFGIRNTLFAQRKKERKNNTYIKFTNDKPVGTLDKMTNLVV